MGNLIEKSEVYADGYPGSAPTKDPGELYVKVPGIDYNDFMLGNEKMSDAKRTEAYRKLDAYENTQRATFMGYQANQKLEYQSLARFLDFQVNNIGDPFTQGNFTLNCKFIERAVLDYFASLWNAQWPHENTKPSDEDDIGWKNSYWGYVTSMGSTEGNVFGLWNARDYLSGRFLKVEPESLERAKIASLNGKPYPAEPRYIYYKAIAPDNDPNKYTPVSFFSQDTHYSVIKIMRVLGVPTFNEVGSGVYPCPINPDTPGDYPDGFSRNYLDRNGWPFEVPSNEDGSIYIPALEKLVEFFASKGYPIMINFNYGTTFKGAFDNVKEAAEKLTPILKKYGLYERKVNYDEDNPEKFDTRTGFWFHVDGALGAAYMPFAEKLGRKFGNEDFPVFDFRIPEVHSISTSGHKWLGAPWPCCVYMTKVKYQMLPPSDPNYIGSPDSTFAGSRNGFSSLILWDYLSRNSVDDLIAKINSAFDLMEYVHEQLKIVQEKQGKDLWIEVSPYALTIRFKRPNEEIVYKYSLSGENLYVLGKERAYSHIYMMESVTKELIDQFISDLSEPGAFIEQEVFARSLLAQNALRVKTLEEVDDGFDPADEQNGIYVPLSGRGFK